jgi:tetratricopeptide (TPR) repeat protein
MLEIPFRGTGWVFLGELGNRRGLSYDSRKLDIERGVTVGQSFIFRADASGTYILKFYKQDFIQDLIINDNVQVIVGERSSTTGIAMAERVAAEPRWPPLPGQEPSASPLAGAVSSPPESPIEDQAPAAATAPPEVVVSAEEYLSRARGEFDAGRVEPALAILDTMMQIYPAPADEALWLYGQLLESNSPSRDVRLALDYYRRLVRTFPQSSRAADAQRRITYLERFYFNIR